MWQPQVDRGDGVQASDLVVGEVELEATKRVVELVNGPGPDDREDLGPVSASPDPVDGYLCRRATDLLGEGHYGVSCRQLLVRGPLVPARPAIRGPVLAGEGSSFEHAPHRGREIVLPSHGQEVSLHPLIEDAVRSLDRDRLDPSSQLSR